MKLQVLLFLICAQLHQAYGHYELDPFNCGFFQYPPYFYFTVFLFYITGLKFQSGELPIVELLVTCNCYIGYGKSLVVVLDLQVGGEVR